MRTLISIVAILAVSACDRPSKPAVPAPAGDADVAAVAPAKPAPTVPANSVLNPLLVYVVSNDVAKAIEVASQEVGVSDEAIPQPATASGEEPASLERSGDFTVASDIGGRVIEDDGVMRLELELGGWFEVARLNVGATRGADCMPADWVEGSEPELLHGLPIVEAKRRTRAIRIEMEGADTPTWVRLGAPDPYLVVEAGGCARVTPLVPVLTGADRPSGEALIGSAFEEGKWRALADDEPGWVVPLIDLEELPAMDVKLRAVPGGVDIVRDGAVLRAVRYPTPNSDGCLYARVVPSIVEGRLEALQFHGEYYFDCATEPKEGSQWESHQLSYRREGRKFVQTDSWQTHPATAMTRILRGRAVEWRIRPKTNRHEYRVDWVDSSDCGHEVMDSHSEVVWEVRAKGGDWKKLGVAERYRFLKSECSGSAGEP